MWRLSVNDTSSVSNAIKAMWILSYYPAFIHTALIASLKELLRKKEKREERRGKKAGEDDDDEREDGKNPAEPDGGERETPQEDEESCVPHIVYGNENLSAPHDCNAVIQLGDEVQDSVNRPLSNIIHAARLKEKLPQGKMKCKKCKEMAKWICNDKECGNIPLCDLCHDTHRRHERTQNHQVVEIDPEKDWWKGINRHTWFCSEHPDRLVDIYCTVHDVVICERCALLNHTNQKDPPCNLKDVNEFYTEADNARILELEKIEELNENFKTAVQRGEDRKISLETKRDDAINALNNRHQQLVQQLTNERDEAIAKANLICDLKKEEIDLHQTKLKCATETMEDSLEFIKDYSDIANPAEFMFLKAQLVQQLDDLHRRYSTFDLSPADDDELNLKPSNNDLPSNLFGKVYSTPCVKEFKVKDHSDDSLDFKFECHDISGSHISGDDIPVRVLPKLKAVVKENGEIDDSVTCAIRINRGNGCYLVSVPVRENGGNKQLHIYQSRPYPHRQYHIRDSPFNLKTIWQNRILIHL